MLFDRPLERYIATWDYEAVQQDEISLSKVRGIRQAKRGLLSRSLLRFCERTRLHVVVLGKCECVLETKTLFTLQGDIVLVSEEFDDGWMRGLKLLNLEV